MRRYDDPVEVRQREVGAVGLDGDRGGGGEGGHVGKGGTTPPESFVWRGRRYRVEAVIGHWHERTPWWRHALEASGPGGDLIMQEEIWRVEAAPARESRPGALGVFDLARGCRWRLIRMAD